MSSTDLGVEITELISIAIAAGNAIMEVYRAPFDVSIKADSSPVTKADLLAEEIILEGLRKTAPGIPIVAEESACAGAMPDVIDTFFLVDPLDGTREFVSRSDEWYTRRRRAKSPIRSRRTARLPGVSMAAKLWIDTRSRPAGSLPARPLRW